MEKDEIVILGDRGIISVSGEDCNDFLQNILSNDINKINASNSLYSAIFTPQGKYLYEFFIIKSDNGYFLDCENEFTQEIIDHLTKYKLRSKIEIKNISFKYVVGIISLDKFKEIQANEKKNSETIIFRDSPIFIDSRSKKLGARILSSLEKLHLTIKKLNLTIIDKNVYLNKAYQLGIPIKGLKNLKEQLFGLEANFEEFKAIDFKKGCYVGQENTSRMKLKNKIRKRLCPISCNKELTNQSEIFYKDKLVGKVLIPKPYSFALIKLFDPNIKDFLNEDLNCEGNIVKIVKIQA